MEIEPVTDGFLQRDNMASRANAEATRAFTVNSRGVKQISRPKNDVNNSKTRLEAHFQRTKLISGDMLVISDFQAPIMLGHRWQVGSCDEVAPGDLRLVNNKVISDFQALHQARAPVEGTEPLIERSLLIP
ncbi:hypothetical protein PoB_002877700 [Plakobranchus ocellatus]|uniref:Uncharacterized protein n=1 Tax=Plakobranchus ocellatus TaxID=259542 RepID=A0AAV4A4S6_9GAST|nr:hypothetical protein PoB_002877700 [Plakobranchus ocellatus]